MERTFVMIKPDAYETGNKDKIFKSILQEVSREETLTVYKVQEMDCTDEFIKKHYEVHKGKDFYDELIGYFKNQKIYGFVIVGDGAIGIMRDYIQDKLRPKYAKNKFENGIHSSDSVESAEFEIENFLSSL